MSTYLSIINSFKREVYTSMSLYMAKNFSKAVLISRIQRFDILSLIDDTEHYNIAWNFKTEIEKWIFDNLSDLNLDNWRKRLDDIFYAVGFDEDGIYYVRH